MPCNSDYMDASDLEQQAARCACLLDELDGKTWTVNDWAKNWAGYHRDTYGRTTKASLDALVRELCRRLQSVDVSQYSLELQTWWRDHKAADVAQQANERLAEQRAAIRRQALARLTPAERRALGIFDS